MLQILENRGVKMSWIGRAPNGSIRVALLIPQFNEASNCNLQSRLQYFREVSERLRDEIDVIIIDDGSTDQSLKEIRAFKDRYPDAFYVSSISPNSNKVGALYLTILAIDHEFVILSDFDTDITGMDFLMDNLATLRKDESLMGCYFRMLPFEGKGSVFLFQQLEYSMARSFYKLHKKELSVPVMPGAGSCYKREVIKEIYDVHSGLRSGEDREATLLGLKLGYKTFYSENVLTLTRPPLSFKSLIKQRIRWNLGYIETFNKEASFYFKQVKKLTRIGMRTVLDMITINMAILLPLIILVGIIANWRLLIAYLVAIYAGCIFLALNAILMAPEESVEFKEKKILSILYYPFYKIPLECIAWTGALITFIKKRKHQLRPA